MNTPNIRFKGFNDDWEQLKLGDISEIRTGPFGSVLHAEDYVSDGMPIITTEHFKTGSLPTNKEGLPQVSDSDYQRLNNYKLECGDIVFSRVGSVDINALVEQEQSDWLFSGRVLRVRPQDKVHGRYLHYLLETKGVKDDIVSRAVGQTMPSINTEILNATTICLSNSHEEQKRIGECLANCDNLITLHQRKCDSLKQVKKYMLQKMFPKQGEKVPEIRFKGFTDDWEQRKFGEIFQEYSEKKHDELPPLMIMQGSGTILRDKSDRNLQYDKSSLSSYKMVKKNDFIVHLRSFEGGLEKANSEGIISPAYHTFHGDNTDTRFYYPFFRSQHFIDVLLKPHVYGIRDGKSIDINGMKTIKIPVPSYEEQQKIGNYIELMDNLITFHQRKSDSLKEIKKFMLQNMFPRE